MDLGLQLALPSLAKATWIDGEVSLATEQVNVPLKTPLQSQANARLTLHNVRAGLDSPALKSVAQTMGRMVGVPNDGEIHVIDNDVVTVTLSDGAVEHSGFRFGLPKSILNCRSLRQAVFISLITNSMPRFNFPFR